MNINDLTVGQAKELAAMFGGAVANNHPYKIGANYFIRTVTHHYTGKLEAVYSGELVLSSAAWIADDGRFQQALESCEFSEVEMYPPDKFVAIGRGAILDAVEIEALPMVQQ